jgi:lysophospholipase L1-like esterase
MDKINIIRELAEEFETKLISLNDVFAKASTKRGSSFWTLDGVHPTLVGHALIAQSWIKDVIEDCEGFIR